MMRFSSRLLQACLMAALAVTMSRPAWAQRDGFSFGVIAQGAPHDESLLREAITDTDADNLAFVLVNGFKQPSEPCTDTLYEGRKTLLDSAKNGLILSLAASDWISCNGAQNHAASIGQLGRVRELFFSGDMSLGGSKLPLIRQSGTVKFRGYVENARWNVGEIMFATVNLPAANNHYLSEAGRNSEFEDRQVATREWLKRIFTYAAQRKMPGIVLFTDGNPLAAPAPRSLFASNSKLDGFREVRRQITSLAEKYQGKVLLIHGQTGLPAAAAPVILWQKNLATLAANRPNGDWIKVNVEPAASVVFKLANQLPTEKEQVRRK
jgi:hypothetical protein